MTEEERALAMATGPAALVDEHGLLVGLNTSLCVLFGEEKGELLGRSVLGLIQIEDRSLVLDCLSSTQIRHGLTRVERVSLIDGRSVRLDVRPRVGAPGAQLLIEPVLNDLQVEYSMALEQRYRTLIDHLGMGVVLVGPDLSILLANSLIRSWFPNLFAMDGRKCYRCVPETDNDSPCENCPTLTALMHGREAVREQTFEVGGVARTFKVLSRPILSEQRLPIAVVETVEDITERRRAELRILDYQERLKAMGTVLAETDERARRRLAESLHDGLGQRLYAVKMILASLRMTPGLVDSGTELLDEALRTLDETLKEARNLTFEVFPPLLYEVGLGAALGALVERRRARGGLSIHLELAPEPHALLIDARSLAYRAVQELLLNVEKHARARNVHVALTVKSDVLGVVVEDDGVGLSSTANPSKGFGLFNLRERAERLGGAFNISSVPGVGTRVTLSIPISAGASPLDENSGV